MVAPNHDAVSDEARLVLEDGQDAGPSLADDFLGITGERVDHAPAVRQLLPYVGVKLNSILRQARFG
jgi:hypothetical protein